MIRELIRGCFSDDEVPEGVIQTERWDDRTIDLFAGPRTARHLLGHGFWGRMHELYAHRGRMTFEIPQEYLVDYDDELSDVAAGLRLVEPEPHAEHCQYPPCILQTARVAGGYSLCAHHGDVLADGAALWVLEQHHNVRADDTDTVE